MNYKKLLLTLVIGIISFSSCKKSKSKPSNQDEQEKGSSLTTTTDAVTTTTDAVTTTTDVVTPSADVVTPPEGSVEITENNLTGRWRISDGNNILTIEENGNYTYPEGIRNHLPTTGNNNGTWLIRDNRTSLRFIIGDRYRNFDLVFVDHNTITLTRENVTVTFIRQ